MPRMESVHGDGYVFTATVSRQGAQKNWRAGFARYLVPQCLWNGDRWPSYNTQRTGGG